MNKKIKMALAALLIVSAPVPSAYAQNAAVYSAAVDAKTGAEQPIQVIVAQSEIKSDINVLTTSSVGGGLLGGLISSAISSSRAKEAELVIAPLRDELIDFDADAMAQDTAKKSFGSYFGRSSETKIVFSKDSSDEGKSAYLDEAQGPNATFVEYIYDMTPDFSALRLVTRISVAPKENDKSGKPLKRLNLNKLLYSTSVVTIVSLKEISKKKEANVAAWAANDAALTREALTSAFSKSQELVKRTLALTTSDLAEANNKSRKKVWVGGLKGRVQTDDGPGTLILAGGYVHATEVN